MSVSVFCEQCGIERKVIPARAKTFRFCSYVCRGKWRSENWTGENHPNWTGGIRQKQCQHCGSKFAIRPKQPITSFKKQKFCSKNCADLGGLRREGEKHPNFKATSRRNDRRGKHGSWARKVLERDKATCQKCGARKVELHAHHIKPFNSFPELRWSLDNGITLCYACHWAEHTALRDNAVNSGKPVVGLNGPTGNPEPSDQRKPVEGVTTRGRAYRRFEGSCAECKAFISKRWSDTIGKANLFCSKSCAGKYNNRKKSMAVISSTSAARESEDIV